MRSASLPGVSPGADGGVPPQGEGTSRARERALDAVVDEVLAQPVLAAGELDAILRRHPKDGRGFFAKREILEAFRRRPRAGVAEAAFAERLRTCPTRSLSGVLPVTVFTRPFPCPGRCVFCPSDVRMPKSYLASEPGCQRAEANRFDPYLQTWNRLDAYRAMGHATDKVELLVLGGTWSSYPEPYQVAFVTRCLEALEDFGVGRDRRAEALEAARDFTAPGPPAPRFEGAASYNRRVRAHLRTLGPEPHEDGAGWEALAAAQRRGEAAACRMVGLVVETRPDHVDAEELVRLRRLGVTKVQVGLQSLDDAVLAANRRGHDAEAARVAATRLRAAGFKLLVHWMPNLLGATPASDRADFARLVGDPAIRPDELKIYPCVLLESAELADFHARGAWQPYDDATLEALVADCLERVPPWCRVTRVIRDIPAPEIAAGSRVGNLREAAEARVRARGGRLRDVRSRELRARAVGEAPLREGAHRYATGVGEERFLEWTTAEGHLVAWLRLALPRRDADAAAGAPLAELEGRALVREVHVVGPATALGARGAGHAQHRGLGAKLVARAARIAEDAGYEGLAVISSVGTRPWYRRLGFRDGALYQHLPLRGADAASKS